MAMSIGKSADAPEKMAALVSKIGSSLNSYVSARTAIRDYVISADEKYYTQVEDYVAQAIIDLGHAESMAADGGTGTIIHELINSIRDWSVTAHQVRDAFASYHETVKSKILANFVALSESGNALVRLNALLMTGVLLDLQAAHTAVTSYLNNGDDQLLASANSALNSAKMRINQAERSEEPLRAALRSFTTNLDTYAEGLRKAVSYRGKAHRTFKDELAPLGGQTQNGIERLLQEMIEQQRRSIKSSSA